MRIDVPATMTAMECVSTGVDSEVLQLVERPTPTPQAGEVLIGASATGLSGAARRSGSYVRAADAGPILGLEVSGNVVSLGSGATGFAIGDKVCALLSDGGYAEYCVAPQTQTLLIPKGIDLISAAGIMENLCTVWVSLFDRGGLKAGESVLIHGGTSGIGVMAIQFASASGARVFATAGTDEKCEACERLGAVKAINYNSEDFAAVIRAEQPKGVDVILDIVAGRYLKQNLDSLAIDGRMCVIGLRGGTLGELDFGLLMQRRLTVSGSTLRNRSAEDKARIVEAVHHQAWPMIEQGRIELVTDSVFALADAAQAHDRLAKGRHIGKILLRHRDREA